VSLLDIGIVLDDLSEVCALASVGRDPAPRFGCGPMLAGRVTGIAESVQLAHRPRPVGRDPVLLTDV